MDNLISSSISLKLHLQSSHFIGAFNGGQLMNSISPGANSGLILRCTAQIGNLYQEYTEIELGIPQRDPIPARGKIRNYHFHFLMLFYLYIFIHLHMHYKMCKWVLFRYLILILN